MRFVRIKATNFLSHVDTEVKFDGYDAVVVVGPNGSGKSAGMIDAPLVALFGHGRSGDLDGYIRNGADVMTAEFDFALVAGLYRVVRKRSKKTSRGTSSLDFYEIDGSGNVARVLTGGGVGETESIIRKVIGTDFDTLVRSSVIEQGEADFFCSASPSERMELFSKIWDLEKYEAYEGMARDVAKETSERRKAIDERVEGYRKKITEIAQAEAEGETLRARAEAETGTIAKLERQKESLQKRLTEFEGMSNELNKARGYCAEARKDMKTVGEEHGVVLAKIERYRKILKNRDVVMAKVEEEKAVIAEIERLETIVSDFINRVDRIREDEKKARAEVQAEIDKVDLKVRENDAETEKARKTSDEASRMLAAVLRKEDRAAQMRVDAGKLKGIQCHPDYDPAYVNETCRFIKDAAIAKKALPDLEEEISKERKAAEAASMEADTRMVILADDKSKLIDQIRKIKDGLAQRIKEIDTAAGALVLERKKTEEKIAVQKGLLEEVRKYTKLVPEISLAETELPGMTESSKRLETRCQELSAKILKEEKEIERIEKALAGRKDVSANFDTVSGQLAIALQQKDDLIKRLGSIEASLAEKATLKEKVKEDEKEIEALSGKKALYSILEDAFKQIPYMLVTRGIGAVENIANEILGMISSTGMRVTIKTDKVTKTTKKVRDEIHLVIQDSEGVKQYKMLSGGEKLRVALALRLAIGEVFAHRRGVSIDSLIADEPFGPLDVEGIEDMKEAMRELRKRFQFMGVITHVDRAMDIFPVRLVFEKDGQNGTKVTRDEGFV
ncbi:MAG: SMC family ATPase [Deltaproteobacteria bacterium]|nr:MAG: SMC family ATPase [Deltaproteobacteria bacterium]